MLRSSIAGLQPAEIREFVAGLTDEEALVLFYDWPVWARPKQLPPDPAEVGAWFVWLVLAGRGFGKTEQGAEAVRLAAASGQVQRIALVGETAADGRDVMIEEPDGILKVSPPNERPVYSPSKRLLEWPNGCVGKTYSGEDPDQRLIDPLGIGNFIWIDPLARFAVATGLRKGELRHLRWSDVDLREGKLFVRSYKAVWRGKKIVFKTKCNSDRVIPLYPMALRVLARRQARRISESPSEPVFLGSRAGRLGSSQINRAFRVAREEAELPAALDMHACRHTFASWLLSAGVPIFRVSKLLGHRKVSLTVETYGHLVPQPEDAGEVVFAASSI